MMGLANGVHHIALCTRDLKEQIEAIPGILEVRRVGGVEREIRVFVNPDKLQYHNLDLNQVSQMKLHYPHQHTVFDLLQPVDH